MTRTVAHITDELKTATSAGDLAKIKELLEEWASSGSASSPPLNELLSTASQNGYAHVVSYLLERGASVDVDVIVSAFATANVDVFQAFVDGGFDINTNLGHIGDLLILSLRNPDLLKWVLAQGANPNLHHTGMRSALDLAVINSSAEAAQLLIQHGANVKNTNALKAAAWYGNLDMITLLLEAGADVNEIPDYEQMLRSEREDGLGTALHEAAEGGQKEAVELLLERGADPSLKNSVGKTALDIAKEKQQVAVIEVLEK
ncbi:ankyrin repeat-containing domain protein [Lyophyllum atratum]|nr:ankyrin repeat-containing domain protein [Lyophyllum atratum]